MKLTPKQNQVINCMQNDWILITSGESKTIWCGNHVAQFEFGSYLFFNLINKDLINQQLRHPYDYVLTTLGECAETKDVHKDIENKYKI